MSTNSISRGFLVIFGVGFGSIWLLILISNGLRLTTYVANVPCTVIKAENVRISDESSSYRLFCEQETFDIKDDLLTGRFRSSDMYGAISNLSKGSEISLDVWGIRFGPTSAKRSAINWRQ
jgi:hypothetical protein